MNPWVPEWKIQKDASNHLKNPGISEGRIVVEKSAKDACKSRQYLKPEMENHCLRLLRFPPRSPFLEYESHADEIQTVLTHWHRTLPTDLGQRRCLGQG